MLKILEVTHSQGELIASILAKGTNVLINDLSPNQKISLLVVANAFRSIDEVAVISFVERSEPHESRYHFTNENPFSVTTEEGDVKLGAGWLAISEREYAELRNK